MQIKKQLTFLMLGLLTSFEVVSARPTLQITYLSGFRQGNIPSGQLFSVDYNITNPDSTAHAINFSNNYIDTRITSVLTAPCTYGNLGAIIPANGTCSLRLNIIAIRGRLGGGPFVCIDRTICSQPDPTQVLDIRVIPNR